MGKAVAVRRRHEWLCGESFWTTFFVTAVVILLTWGIWAIGSGGYDRTAGYQDLASSYQALDVGQQGLPQSPEKARDLIAARWPRTVARVADRSKAYDYLVHHQGQTNVFVVQADKRHLVLLARDHSDAEAVVELDAKRLKTGEYVTNHETLWTGHLNRAHLADGFYVELGLAFLVLLGLGLADEVDYRGRVKQELDRQQQTLDSWHRYVPQDGLTGPDQPTGGFEIWMPHFIEHDQEEKHRVTFEATLQRWGYGSWSQIREPQTPKGLAPVSLPQEATLEEITQGWVEFCSRVGDYNERRWTELESERVERERKEMERGDLKQLLQPGHELVRGIGTRQLEI